MSKEPVYWKMRNGELISVDKMDINHLRNAFKMLIKVHKKTVDEANLVVDKYNKLISNVRVSTTKNNSSFKLNGDIANEFNDSYYSDVDDIQYSDGEFYKH